MNERARIGLVMTGGTIAGKASNSRSDGMLLIDLSQTTVEDDAHLVAGAWPGPEALDLRTRTPLYKFSENLTPQDWVTVADTIRGLVTQEGVRSVVVLHGTDTMGYTCAALSFLLSDVDATVVVTGANTIASELNSDATTNVRDALAASRALPVGVYLSFAGHQDATSSVFLGTTVRKVQAEGFAFAAPNHGPVANVRNGVVDQLTDIAKPHPPNNPVNAMSKELLSLHVHPAMDLDLFFEVMQKSGKRGVVVHLYPCASGPDEGVASLPAFTEKCVANGIAVVTCVERYVTAFSNYPSVTAIAEKGAIFAHDMIPETAFVKLSWALAQAEARTEVERLFSVPVANEMQTAYPIAS